MLKSSGCCSTYCESTAETNFSVSSGREGPPLWVHTASVASSIFFMKGISSLEALKSAVERAAITCALVYPVSPSSDGAAAAPLVIVTAVIPVNNIL